MNPRIRRALIFIIVAMVFSWLSSRGCARKKAPVTPPLVVSERSESNPPVTPTSSLPASVPSETPKPIVPVIPAKPVKPVSKPKPVVETPAASKPLPMQPPPVPIFKELIPKNIEIVRVYYANMISGPDSRVEFDINGSGFNAEFRQMITAESGVDTVEVRDLTLTTPNQIHGTLMIGKDTKTGVYFPKVLIQGKVVFQAADPFAVIRPGEVLNLIFTEMGESGRTGRFRIFTNLTPQMFSQFQVEVTTPTIRVTDLTPSLPFVVDGGIVIGPAVGGDYGMRVKLADKIIWNRDGVIRVVRPNVGQSGLVQRLQVADGFQRPGDRVQFAVLGSGFQPQDASTLSIKVNGLVITNSSFTYQAPGRLGLVVELPKDAAVKKYGVTILHGVEVLIDVPEAFQVVDKNWTRGVEVDPELAPGGKSTLRLIGRDMDAAFIASLKIEVDDPNLVIGSFVWKNLQLAEAPVSANPDTKLGDYWVRLTSNGAAVTPHFGSIIQVSRRQTPPPPK